MTTRRKMLPLLVWVLLAGFAAYLHYGISRRGDVVGYAQGIEHPIAAVRGDVVKHVRVTPGQLVEAGDVLATLDARLLDGELSVARAELEAAQIEAEAGMGRSTAKLVRLGRSLEESSESSARALSQARSGLKVRNAEFKALSEQLLDMRALLGKRLVTRKQLVELEVRHAGLGEEIQAERRQVSLLEQQVAAARNRASAQPKDFAALAEDVVAAKRRVLEERIRRLESERDAATLRAPVAGQVVAVHVVPGSYAKAGQPVVTLVETRTNRVVACYPEGRDLGVKDGALAVLHPKGVGEPVQARVVTSAGRVGALPSRCQPTPNANRFGREVWLAVNDDVLLPGQAYFVKFTGDDTPQHAVAAKRIKELRVPRSLMLRTRFEASGICYSARRRGYLIVSDDTGLADDTEHAPWVFASDVSGNVAEAPVELNGVDEVSDLESCALGHGSKVFLLASQSLSKKGKRPRARQVFLRLDDSGNALRSVGRVDLATLLADLPRDKLVALGVRDLRDLDVEGMTYKDGALYLGLKSPLDDEGRAMVWRLGNPDRLFDENSLTSADLTLWASVRLPLSKGGTLGGISELMFTPRGGLLIASTPTSGKRVQGAIWHAPAPGPGVLKAHGIATYNGHKPEGLSLTPDPGTFVVVFDAGDGPARWETLPLP